MLSLLTSAHASGEDRELRYGIFVGNNQGNDKDGSSLRFAQKDAAEMKAVMMELGGFQKDNTQLLLGKDARELRAAFDRAASRIGSADASTGSRVWFFFFYSGHAGCDGLHLGKSVLPGVELKELVEKIPAEVRVAVVDACHAGALAYLKGGVPAEPFLFDREALQNVEGTAYVMSCGQTERAQESPELEHSIFTYWLLSGLRGAADYSKDGWVTLPEVWEYVKSGTTLSSTRTGIPQRPMWDINIKGQEHVRLTNLHNSAHDGAVLEFSAYGDYWIFNDDSNLVAEVHALLPGHRIALAAGRYLVRRLQEGEKLLERFVTLRKGDWKKLAAREMDEVPYVRLAAKGAGRGRSNRLRHGPEACVNYHGETLDGFGGLMSGGINWPLAFGKWWFLPRFSVGVSSFSRDDLSVSMLELDLSAGLGYGFDFDWLILRPQAALGAFLGHQSVERGGFEPEDLTSLGMQFSGGLSLMFLPFGGRALIELCVESANYLYRHEKADGDEEWKVSPTYRLMLGLGYVL